MKSVLIYAIFLSILITGMFLISTEEVLRDYPSNDAEKNVPQENRSIGNTKSSDEEVTRIFKKYAIPNAPAPKNKHIVFRIDDIGAFWSDNTAINATETFRAGKIPLVLGVIPVNRYGQKLHEDAAITSYLAKIRSDPSIEFALHGYNHDTDEFMDVSYGDALFKISDGIRIFEKTIGTTPVTFIPPYNSYNQNTIDALKKEIGEGVIISSGYYDIMNNIAFNESDGILFMPQTTDIYNYEEDHLHPLDKIANSCEYAISRYGTCVITIHHTRFAGPDGGIDAKKLQTLYDIIDWAKKKEGQGAVKIVRLKDIGPADLR